MYKNLFKNWRLVSPGILGAACVCTLSATATATPIATEAVKSQTAAANIPEIHQDDSVVSPISAKEAETVTAQKTLLVASQNLLADNLPVTTDTSVIAPIEHHSNDNNDNNTDDPMGQVNSVSQFSDVQPTDWAFEALRSLVERYGCIAGYPNGTYRGNRVLSRYEFSAGLNACLQVIERLVANRPTDFVRQQDLVTVQRLISEFGPELALLRANVDGLQARTRELELTQFSTTTKLNAEVVLGVTGIVSGDDIFSQPVDNVTILGSRTRLNLDTSFTGRDLLRTRLQASGLNSFTSRTQTFEGNLAFAAENANNNVQIDALLYKFPIGKNTEVVIAANGGKAGDFASTVNVLDGDGGAGALTRFGTRNPIYYLVEGSGIGLRHQFGDKIELSLGYLAGESNNPASNSGLFSGAYGAMGQFVYKPNSRFQLGLTYINSYNRETLTGSPLSNSQTFLRGLSNQPVANGTLGDLLRQPDFAGIPLGFDLNIPIASNSYGLQLSWQMSDRFVLGGWFGYTQTSTLSTGNGLFSRGTFDTLNGAITLAFPNLGKKGNLGGIIVGVEPFVLDTDVRVNPNLTNPASLNPSLAAAGVALFNSAPALGQLVNSFSNVDPDVSLHVEAFYQMQLTDNISITPGVIWITAPGSNSNNSDLVIGTIRTTFRF